MKTFALFVLLASSVFADSESEGCRKSVTTASGTRAPRKICAGQIIFEDKFDTFDLSVWDHENTLSGGRNWEFQWYGNNRSNSYVENGILYITPSLTSETLGGIEKLRQDTLKVYGGTPADQCTDAGDWGCERQGTQTHVLNPIRSARIRTPYSFNFKYGVVEVRAKVPRGDWLWPAIWLMPRYHAYGTWPQSGEIDLMESRGNQELVENGKDIGVKQVGQTLHFGPYPSLNGYTFAHGSKNHPQGYDADFHVYKMKWTPKEITFYIDNEVVKTNRGPFWPLGQFDHRAPGGTANPWKTSKSKMAPFDQEFYFIMNVAVGGTIYFPDSAANKDGAKPWKNNSPQAATDFWNGRNQWMPSWGMNQHQRGQASKAASLQVDYVRVWALDGFSEDEEEEEATEVYSSDTTSFVQDADSGSEN